MNQLLRDGQRVYMQGAGLNCTVGDYLGGGGQGEVYQVRMDDGTILALKWYFAHTATGEQRSGLEMLVRSGAPGGRFLWPLDVTISGETRGFGYVMPLRSPRYVSIVEVMKRRVEPSFRALLTAGAELAHSFFQLHARGLCYRDISFDNVFFDTQTGETLICDNDNVAVDGAKIGGILGTPRFMAPEVVRGDALPNTQSDLFSLSVLLFYMLMMHHPLEGKRESAIRCFDLPAMNRLYGTEPLFIFDPGDHSNAPLPDYHDNALAFWPIYPQFVHSLFTRAFTDGLRDPQRRVRESEWRAALLRLRDEIVYCSHCQAENFCDVEAEQRRGPQPLVCWLCGQAVKLPPRIRIGKTVVMLNHDAQLFPHHTDPHRLYDFSAPVAQMKQHPSDAAIWGLQNVSPDTWQLTTADGSIRDVPPTRSATVAVGSKIHFGDAQGEIQR